MLTDRSYAQNYCRNPDDEPEGPWCYTMNPGKRWEYCDIEYCECKTSKKGVEYRGETSETRSGLKCQRWDSQTPHSHTRYEKLDDKTTAENYCRNPDDEPEGPWCYTLDPAKRWEYCDVPLCSDVTAKATTSSVPGAPSTRSTMELTPATVAPPTTTEPIPTTPEQTTMPTTPYIEPCISATCLPHCKSIQLANGCYGCGHCTVTESTTTPPEPTSTPPGPTTTPPAGTTTESIDLTTTPSAGTTTEPVEPPTTAPAGTTKDSIEPTTTPPFGTTTEPIEPAKTSPAGTTTEPIEPVTTSPEGTTTEPIEPATTPPEGTPTEPVEHEALPEVKCTDATKGYFIHGKSLCGVIRYSDAFTDCRNKVPNFADYINDCEYDACQAANSGSNEFKDVACGRISTFVSVCINSGGGATNWRPRLCDKKCPDGMVYKDMIETCMNTCLDKEAVSTCSQIPTGKAEGCVCKHGYYYHQGICVQTCPQ
ncbi:uncharacterized protein LOC141911403 isoform X2 [Tubulanus polymorphus]|uniref:uncharacterized protein LOC141911403 isoform X2 n=1 Tax=Tubulanus polymorphus TaxID=672921 RepID=UPI003DA1D187